MRPLGRDDPERFLSSPFRIDWLDERLTRNEREDLERAVAEKAASILRVARFAQLIHDRSGTESEMRVWLETGFDPAMVSVHYEARLRKHYVLVLDWQGRERLGAVVFEGVPSVTGDEVRNETRAFMAAFRRAVDGREDAGFEMGELVEAVQTEYRTGYPGP